MHLMGSGPPPAPVCIIAKNLQNGKPYEEVDVHLTGQMDQIAGPRP